MSYEEVTAEINELRARLSKKKSEFISAKENVDELKSLLSDFDKNNVDFDEKGYKKVANTIFRLTSK